MITFRRIPIAGEAVVVAFDMCSSADLLEEFTLRGDLERYKVFLNSLKHHLADAQKKVDFDPYKFTGDGWILLFPGETSGELIWQFLTELCSFYENAIREQLRPYVASLPPVQGLTFGLECGPIYKVTMFQQREYFGRPIVIACRLQNAVKDTERAPAYKALVSPSIKSRYFSLIEAARSTSRSVELRNVREGRNFRVQRINLRPNRSLNRTVPGGRPSAPAGTAG